LEYTTYYSLNPTGTCIWQGIKAGLRLRDVSLRLQARFAVAADHADRSVLAFIHELAQQQLVQVSAPSSSCGMNDGAC
jgi:hypothetical protein